MPNVVPPPRRMLLRLERALGWISVATLLPLLLLGAWEIAIRTGWFPRALLASPLEVARDAVRLMADGTLPKHAGISLRRLAVGFAAGSVLAIGMGTLVGLSRAAERIIAPTIGLLAPVPVSAWIPLIIIVAGIGEVSKSSVIAVGTFFVVFFATFHGIRSVDPKLVEVAHVYGKRPSSLVIQVLLPAAVGSIMQGMRTALGLGWVLLIVAEVIASADGLGWMMWDARNFGRPDDMLVGMVATGVLGAGTDCVLAGIQRWLLFWRPSFEGQ